MADTPDSNSGAVRIVTDSAADIPPALADELGIVVVPLSVRFGTEELVDGRDLTPEQFYARLGSATELPETSAPSPGAFEQAFHSAPAVVCITISSSLSGTMDAARAAARPLNESGAADVRVLDSRSVSWGEGSQVVAAARAARAGATADEIVALVTSMTARTRVYATLDTLENLKKGGRIGNAQAMLGTLLSIKPLLDLSSGVTEEAGKVRTRSKALRALAAKVAEAGPVEELAVMHALAPDADELVRLLAEHHPANAVHVGVIGATVGVHGGPGVIAVTFQVADQRAP